MLRRLFFVRNVKTPSAVRAEPAYAGGRFDMEEQK